MLQKLIKFVKENLVAVVGIAAIAVSLLLILIPGQFAHFNDIDGYKMNGYQFFFNTVRKNGEVVHPFINQEAIALPAGIAIFVLMTLAIVSLVLWRKTSLLVMLGGLFNVVSAILFFSMEASVDKVYDMRFQETIRGKVKFLSTIGWTSYLSGAILLLAGAYIIYKAVLMMKDEIKHPAQPKGPTYNYLKK